MFRKRLGFESRQAQTEESTSDWACWSGIHFIRRVSASDFISTRRTPRAHYVCSEKGGGLCDTPTPKLIWIGNFVCIALH
jgi:hypothetical protein